MTFTYTKSAIAEVKDQLSLDFADDEYLNIVGQNLGVHKHFLSFDDSIWRALIKTLGLDYKQVVSKFADVLTIIFGPKITQVGTLASPVIAGDSSFFLNDVTRFPQVGTFVFDKGLATEETLPYVLMNRSTNEVFLQGIFAFPHSNYTYDIEEEVLCISPTGQVVCISTDYFPTSFPYSLIINRGQDTEEAVTVTSATGNVLTVAPVPTGLFDFAEPTEIFGKLAFNILPDSNIAILEDSTQFPSNGIVKFTPSTSLTVGSNSSGVGAFTINIAAIPSIANSLCSGFEVVFNGNITSALAGVRRRIVTNTSTVITVSEDFTEPGNFPHTGDTFKIYPIVKYTSNEVSTGILTLQRNIPSAFSIPSDSRVELLRSTSTASLAPVMQLGAGWDIIQSTPRLLELFIPHEIRDINDIRSASYLHDDITVSSLPSTTVLTSTLAGDVGIPISSNLSFPDCGAIIINGGTGTEEIVSYGIPSSSTRNFATKADTELFLKDTSMFPSTGTITISEGSPLAETKIVTANDIDNRKLTISTGLARDHKEGTVVKARTYMMIPTPLEFNHTSGQNITYFNPLYDSTDLPIGDYNWDPNTFPGPYVYDFYEPAPTDAATGPVGLEDLAYYRYDISPVGASAAVRFDNTSISAATVCRIGDSSYSSPYLPQNNVAVLSGLQVGDFIQLERVSFPGQKLLMTVNGAPNDGGTFYGIPITDLQFIGGFPNTLTSGQYMHITTWRQDQVAITAPIPGPTLLSIDQSQGNTSLEVEDALPMLVSGLLPFDVSVGRDTVFVSRVSLKNRVKTTVAVAGALAGDTILPVVSVAGTVLDGAAFPLGTGFRIIINEGQSNAEVAFVRQALVGTNELVLDFPLEDNHVSTETVALMSDVLTVTSLLQSHKGLVDSSFRHGAAVNSSKALYPAPKQTPSTKSVRPRLDCVNLTSAGALSATGGRILLNFGCGSIPAKSKTNAPLVAGIVSPITLIDGSGFPSVFPYEVILGPRTRKEERLLVTNRTGNLLTIAGGVYPVRYDHPEGTEVQFTCGKPELLEYNDIDGTELCFNLPTMLKYTHYPVETVIGSYIDSIPSDDGFSFPLRVPVDLAAQLAYLFDLIRAAGVKVEVISKR